MRVPISWWKEFVDVPIPAEELAERLTFAGLEVSSLQTIGLPGSPLPWDPERILVGQVLEVRPHPMRIGWFWPRWSMAPASPRRW
jgi:phenylalanyl-tRNA synthetase beta chain